MRKIAVANMKGGVGKTTISMMLAESLAKEGNKVLLVDLDAQGSLSYSLMGSERFEEIVEDKRTLPHFFKGRIKAAELKPLRDYVERSASFLQTCHTLDLVPTEPTLQGVEREVVTHIGQFGLTKPFRAAPEQTVSKWLLDEVQKLRKYQYLIFDCPPGISIFAHAGIRNSDIIIIPATPDYLSLLAVRSMHSITLPDATGDLKRKPKIKIILNKCRGGTSAPATYRKRLNTFIEQSKWTAELSDIELSLKQKLADATETEDRVWKSFASKYDTFDAEQVMKLATED